MDLFCRECFVMNGSEANQTYNETCFIGQSNVTSTQEQIPEDHNFYKIVVAILTSLLALVILVGNGLIIASVTVVRKLRQPANYLIVSLALSDFLVALVVLPLTIVYDILGEWVFGPTICNIHVSVDVICCATSILNLCMISIDRYLMVTRPMKYPKKRTAKLMAVMIATAWILACLFIFPALFGFTKNVTDDPAWMYLGPSSGIPDGYLNSSHQVWAKMSHITTQEGSTYWTKCDSASSVWQFSIDLEREYYTTHVRFDSPNSTMLNAQLQTKEENTSKINETNFYIRTNSVSKLAGLPTRYIRILLNESDPDIVAKVSVEIFGELIHEKTCLISQEVWFTIYSTVGSFYIPLAVMLCMYYKIYLEASRFKARQRMRSKSLSDQPNSLLSQSLRRKKKKKEYIIAEDSSTDLMDNADIMIRSMDTADSLIRSSPNDRTPEGDDIISRVENGDKALETTLTSRDDVFDSSQIPKQKLLSPEVANGRRQFVSDSQIHDKNKSCNNGTKQACRRTSSLMPLEINGNALQNNKQFPNLTRSASWCKTLHYSAASVNQPDTKSVPNHATTNGRLQDAAANDKKHFESFNKLRSNSLRQSFHKNSIRKSSILSRKISTRRGSLLSLASGAKKGGMIVRRFSSTSRERLRNAKAIRTLGIIVAVFTFCWLPFFILTFIRPFVCVHPESKDCFPLWLVRLVLWLGYLNSALNPIIYVGFSPDLRETFRFLICCKCTNVDRRLAQIELKQAIEEERKGSLLAETSDNIAAVS